MSFGRLDSRASQRLRRDHVQLGIDQALHRTRLPITGDDDALSEGLNSTPAAKPHSTVFFI
jgi:hypothetical protein